MQSLAWMGYPDYYIEPNGAVWHELEYSGGRFERRAIRMSRARDGQHKVNLRTVRGSFVTCLVSRLVAECYVEREFPELDTIVYRDGDKMNPHSHNLMWRTRAFAHEYNKIFRTEQWVLDDNVLLMCEQDGMVFTSYEAACVTYGITRRSILRSVIRGEPCWPTDKTFVYRSQ